MLTDVEQIVPTQDLVLLRQYEAKIVTPGGIERVNYTPMHQIVAVGPDASEYEPGEIVIMSPELQKAQTAGKVMVGTKEYGLTRKSYIWSRVRQHGAAS